MLFFAEMSLELENNNNNDNTTNKNEKVTHTEKQAPPQSLFKASGI